MDGARITAVFVLFLLVIVLAGSAGRSPRRRRPPRPPRRRDPAPIDDVDADDIADDNAPSRDDD